MAAELLSWIDIVRSSAEHPMRRMYYGIYLKDGWLTDGTMALKVPKEQMASVDREYKALGLTAVNEKDRLTIETAIPKSLKDYRRVRNVEKVEPTKDVPISTLWVRCDGQLTNGPEVNTRKYISITALLPNTKSYAHPSDSVPVVWKEGGEIVALLMVLGRK